MILILAAAIIIFMFAAFGIGGLLAIFIAIDKQAKLNAARRRAVAMRAQALAMRRPS